MLAVRGRVLPASAQRSYLMGEYEDGSDSSRRITDPESPGRGSNVSASNLPMRSRLEEAVDAIKEADAIIIGPGKSVYKYYPELDRSRHR